MTTDVQSSSGINWFSTSVAIMVSTIIACALTFFAPTRSSEFVVLDVARIQAAQAKIASQMVGNADSTTETITRLSQVSTNVQRVISEVAGSDKIVLVKQAVVSTELPDITDDVLRHLGLPLDAVVNYSIPMPSGAVSTAQVNQRREAIKKYAEGEPVTPKGGRSLDGVLP